MTNVSRISPFLSVATQLDEAAVAAAAAQGFRAIVNNRPDGEGDDQPAGATLAAAAERLGLDYRHVPVVPGRVTDDDVAAFERALAELKGPVLAFCRTGTRSTTLWALAEAERLHPDAVLASAHDAGFDLDAMRPRLEARWQSAKAA